jgi:hypothetical protein
MRDSDGEIILDWSKAFRFHLTEQDIKETCEMLGQMAEMKRNGMTQEEILCEIFTDGTRRSET